MKPFIRNDHIDTRAEEVISLYERKTKTVVSPPVPIEEVLMQAYELYIDWDNIEEVPGSQILGGLNPEKRTIILNSAQRELFDSTLGLERSTIGHEAGHWEYDVDKGAIGQPALFDIPPSGPYLRAVSKKYGPIIAFRGNVRSTDENPNAKLFDSPEQCRVVNRFAAALSMPRHLVKEAIKDKDLCSWSVLYKLRDLFGVSISALTVRLQQLGYIYLKGKDIYRSKAEAHGQATLDI